MKIQDAPPATRLAVACRIDTPPEALTRLAGDTYVAVRYAVVWHPATPPETLRILANDPDAGVRLPAQRRLADLEVKP